MATLTAVSSKGRQAALDKLAKDVNRLAGGLALPIGTHTLRTAEDPKTTFGILNVEARDKRKWALPIVAGTVTTEAGDKVHFVLSAEPSAKTLVVPENVFLEMQPNTTYSITVEMRNGNKRVVSVVPAEIAVVAGTDEDDE